MQERMEDGDENEMQMESEPEDENDEAKEDEEQEIEELAVMEDLTIDKATKDDNQVPNHINSYLMYPNFFEIYK